MITLYEKNLSSLASSIKNNFLVDNIRVIGKYSIGIVVRLNKGQLSRR